MKIRANIYHYGRWCGSLAGNVNVVKTWLREYYPAELGFTFAVQVVKG